MLKEWIQTAKQKGASDLHLEVGVQPMLRIRGELIPVGSPISSEATLHAAKELLNGSLWQEFLHRRSSDLSLTFCGTRCRVNIFQTMRGVSLSIRLLSSFQNNLRESNLHPDIKNLIKSENGLLIISGPTSSGKSTTLAALIEEMNVSSRRHILSIESPIEYFFTNRQSFIRQREVPTHTPSFEQAIIDSMREDPDVLMIGEMRTSDVMRLTLNAAETGHLVLSTIHSSTCAEALTRICMSFPAESQGSVRAQLADCLVGVICQRLVFLPREQILVPQCEILLANSSAKASIRSGQFSQLATAIQTGGDDGMWSFERYQRWIDQKKDWVRPSLTVPPEEKQLRPPLNLASLELRPASAPSRIAAPQSTPQLHEEGRIQIDSGDDDLEELARKLAQDDDK